MTVRRACAPDIDEMVRLVEASRRQREAYQPLMWKKANDSEELTRRFFGKLVEDSLVTALVCEQAAIVEGFLIATVIPTPPVYDPGGETVLVDDFCVRDPSLWASVGRDLLQALSAGRRPTWRQMMVICADADKAKSVLLADLRLTIASNWWTTPFPT